MVHQVLHLTDSVILHGPLTEYSTFPFESFNAVAKNAIQGTFRIEQAIANGIALKQSLLKMVAFLSNDATETRAHWILQKLKVCFCCLATDLFSYFTVERIFSTQ